MKRHLLICLGSILLGYCMTASETTFEDPMESELKPGWFWLRENPAGWRMTGEALEIKVEPGNMWGGSNNAKNVLLRPLEHHGWTDASVTVQNHPGGQYEQVNLVWYYSDSHMVKIGQEQVDGQWSIVMGREENDRTRTICIIPISAHQVRVRFVVEGDQIVGFYRLPDSETWLKAGECDLPVLGDPKISIQAYQGPVGSPRWAKVRDFKLVSAKPSLRRPNLIYIMADDLGWSDLGCQGSDYYRTPSIDKLASQGMRFDAFYVNQNCAPTRAALMSGQYAPRTGIYTVNTLERGKEEDRLMHVPTNVDKLPLPIKTVADVLKGAGYVTGMFGKWHLGLDADHHPGSRGFDEAVQSNGRHFDFKTNPVRSDIPEGAYLADYITDLAVDFIKRHQHEPFFLYLPHFAVHSPYHAKRDLIEKYKERSPQDGHHDPVYAAMIASVDESVGRVMAALEESGIRGNTVLIFSSDNGGVGGYDRTEPKSSRRGITDNAPLRGGKGTLYEGGIRVPFIVSWPGKIEMNTSCTVPGIHVDILPTFASLAGASLPDQPLDGTDLSPLFFDKKARLDRTSLYWHFPGYLESYVHRPTGWRTTPVSVIRDGDYKLMDFIQENRVELYDLSKDPGEHHDLAAEMPEKTHLLIKQLHGWRHGIAASMPTWKN